MGLAFDVANRPFADPVRQKETLELKPHLLFDLARLVTFATLT